MSENQIEELIEKTIQRMMARHPCYLTAEERKDVHRVCDKDNVDYILDMADAYKQSGADKMTLVGLFSAGKVGQAIGRKFMSFVLGSLFIIGCTVLVLAGYKYIIVKFFTGGK